MGHVSMLCCAFGEISGLSNHKSPKAALKNLIVEYNYNEDDIQLNHFKTVIIFTGASSRPKPPRYSERFSEFIAANNLGHVGVLAPFKNRNTGRFITTYLWHTNLPALQAWWLANKDETHY